MKFVSQFLITLVLLSGLALTGIEARRRHYVALEAAASGGLAGFDAFNSLAQKSIDKSVSTQSASGASQKSVFGYGGNAQLTHWFPFEALQSFGLAAGYRYLLAEPGQMAIPHDGNKSSLGTVAFDNHSYQLIHGQLLWSMFGFQGGEFHLLAGAGQATSQLAFNDKISGQKADLKADSLALLAGFELQFFINEWAFFKVRGMSEFFSRFEYAGAGKKLVHYRSARDGFAAVDTAHLAPASSRAGLLANDSGRHILEISIGIGY